jgi:alpha-beta hydrolase superfamily lysophospholipase
MRATTSSPATTDYAEAVARVAALQALVTDAITPLCHTHLLSHGRRSARAVIFLHGLTNCPRQFASLAQTFFAQGSNVLNARIPHHGLRDRLTDELADLSAKQLTDFTGNLLDLAHGLGEEVTLAGISLGATMALWAAQQRADLERAVAIAPLIAPQHVPAALLPLLRELALSLPNFYVWWDGARREGMRGPQHAYPRFATRAMAETLRLAAQVSKSAARPGAVPKAREVLLVINASDPAVDNRASLDVVRQWRAHGASGVQTYEFAASLKLLHDIIDEEQPEQRTTIVYPIIIDLIGEGTTMRRQSDSAPMAR